MARYDLSMHNDKLQEVIKSGNLEKIDNFIYENNIESAEDLFNLVNRYGNYDNWYGLVFFEITSPQDGIKNRPIFYKDQINLVKEDNDILKKLLLKNILSNKQFRQNFFDKILSPKRYAKITKNSSNGIKTYTSPIAEKINDFIEYDNRYWKKINSDEINSLDKATLKEKYKGKFSKVYNSIIYVKRKHANLRKYAEFGELEEIEEMLDINYSEKRKLVEFLLQYTNTLKSSSINISRIDEFEELLIHDQNSDIDRIRNYNNSESDMVKVKKLSFVKETFIPKEYQQISIFDK